MPDPVTRLEAMTADADRLNSIRSVRSNLSEDARIPLSYRWPLIARHNTASGGNIFRFLAVNASRGKYARAEPVAALYEQGKVHHVGSFPELEDQMCTWTPKSPADASPDRMDALVWAISHLINRRITKIWT